MKLQARGWARSHALLVGAALLFLGGTATAVIAALFFPHSGKVVINIGVAVLMLAFAAFYAWARFPISPRPLIAIGISTLSIGEQLSRTRALFQRIMVVSLVAWCLGVTLLGSHLTAAKRNGFVIAGAVLLSLAGGLLVRNRLRCPRCGTDFRKERIAKLGRWSMDTRRSTEIWDACPHCGVSFKEPYR